jgi:hypothetical protein
MSLQPSRVEFYAAATAPFQLHQKEHSPGTAIAREGHVRLLFEQTGLPGLDRGLSRFNAVAVAAVSIDLITFSRAVSARGGAAMVPTSNGNADHARLAQCRCARLIVVPPDTRPAD